MAEPFNTSSTLNSFTLLSSALHLLAQGGDISNNLSTTEFLEKLGLSTTEHAKKTSQLLEQAWNATDLVRQLISNSLALLSDQMKSRESAERTTISIDALPDELISMIAEQAYANGQMEVIMFSRVCRRWRNITLSLPRLWCRLPCHSVGMTRLLFQRSQAAPLDIHIYRIPKQDSLGPITDLYEDIKRQFERVRSFDLFLESDPDVDGILQFMGFVGVLLKDLKGLILETLTISCNSFDDEENRNISMDDSFHFYTSWDMPGIRTLNVANFVPRPVFGESLRSLSIEFAVEHVHDCKMWDLGLLLDFLRSIPQLEALSIRMSNSVFLPYEAASSITLLSLKSLTMDVALHDSDANEVLRPLLEAINMPNVSELTISTDIRDWGEIDYWLHCIFHDTANRFSHVERLDIQVRRFGAEYCRFGDFLAETPKLSHLSINVVREDDGASLWHPITPSSDMPPLRTLRLAGFEKNGPSFCDTDALDIAEIMKAGSHWEKLERFELHGCPAFESTLDLIKEIVPKEKLIWRDHKR